MSLPDLLKNLSEDTPIPFVINNDSGAFLLQSHVRRYYFYMRSEMLRHWRRSAVLIVNFEHISHLFIVFLKLPDSTTSAMVNGK